MATLSYHTLFGYLTDESGKSFYLDNNRNVQLSTTPKRMKNLLDGWIEMEVRYTRNTTYLGLDRAFTPQLKAVKDSARIIRHILYTGYQTENKLFFLQYRKNILTGIYEIYGRPLEVDLLESEDFEEGVAIRLVDAGAAKYIKANENKVYEIPFTNNDQAVMDGIIMEDTLNYDFYNYESFGSGDGWVGISFINNEGDSVGIEMAGQSAFTPIGTGLNLSESGNYFLGTANDTTITIEGSISLQSHPDRTTPTPFLLYLATNLSQPYLETGLTHAKGLVGGTNDSGQRFRHNNSQDIPVNGSAAFAFDTTFDLESGERLFMIVFNQDDTYPFTVLESSFKVKLNTRNKTMVCNIMRPFELFQKIIDNVTGNRYTVKSDLLQSYEGYTFTSGDAIRKLPDAKIKISLNQFFKFWFARGAALGIDHETQVIWLEDQTYPFDNNTEIINLGEVSNFKRTIYKDIIFNDIKVGSRDQTYDKRNGRYEVNSEQEYSTPVLRQQKELNLITDIRTDAYGIDFLISDTQNKETTDTSSDNEVFAIHVTINPVSEETFIHIDPEGKMVFNGSLANRLPVGAKFTIIGSQFNDGTYTVVKAEPITGFVNITVDNSSTSSEEVTTTVSFHAHLLTRLGYIPFSGVPETYFNMELSPKRSLFSSEQYWAGGIIQMYDKAVEFLNGKKNVNVIAGAIKENNNIPISGLVSYWRPIVFTFDTKLPIDINDKITQNGYVTFSYNGVELQGFIDDVGVKPAFNETQTWKLICSSLTDISLLENIEESFLQVTDKGMISHKNPFKFVPAGLTYPLQYHFKQMDIDWQMNRIKRFSNPIEYYQKWQQNDETAIQLIIRDASIELGIYDCKGKLVLPITPTTKADPYVKYPWTIYEATVNFSTLQPGLYTLQLTVGVGVGAKYYLSEPFIVGAKWANTSLIEYKNSSNLPDMVFTTGFSSRIRVEAGIAVFNPKFKRTSFEDEPLNISTILGRNYRVYDLTFGDDGVGISDGMADKLAAILSQCDYKVLDGMKFDLQADAEMERREIQGSPNADYIIPIREAINLPGLTVDGSGFSITELTVEYDINTRAFTNLETPNANQEDTIIHIEEVE